MNEFFTLCVETSDMEFATTTAALLSCGKEIP